MSFTKSLAFILAALTFTSTHAVNFNVTNRCQYTVWAAATRGGKRLDRDQSWSLDQNPDFQSIWGRTNCNFDSDGRGSCETGDCGGALECSVPGRPPLTLAEFALKVGNNNDYYDLSVIDGYNVPMSLSPTNGACARLRCTDPRCPDAYRFPNDGIKPKACPSGSTGYNIVFCP